MAMPAIPAGAPEANYNRLGKLNGVRFKDSRNGVVVGDNGVILLTQDGENDELTFTKINIFGDTPKPWPNMNSIDMDDLGTVPTHHPFAIITALAYRPAHLVSPISALRRDDADSLLLTDNVPRHCPCIPCREYDNCRRQGRGNLGQLH
jgi:hypothetical protein